MQHGTRIAMATLLVLFGATTVSAITPGINFQAALVDTAGNPIDTTVSIDSEIWSDSISGVMLWSETQTDVTITDGVMDVVLGSFTAIPDSAFSGDAFLSIAIGGDSPLSPRHQLVSVPSAYRVGTVEGALGGTITGDVTIGSDTKSAAAGDLTVANDLIVGGKATIGQGHTSTSSHAFVAGLNNTASGLVSTVGGGSLNTAGSGFAATVGGGQFNEATLNYATVGGGHSNYATDIYTTVGGGGSNFAQAPYAIVAGGYSNNAQGDSSAVTGGTRNLAIGSVSTVGGGRLNKARGDFTVVAGGGGATDFDSNAARGFASVVVGGQGNVADGDSSFIGGGTRNRAPGNSSAVGGGLDNSTDGARSVVSGGSYNSASVINATVGGGYNNTASGEYSTISGGQNNTASSQYSTISGGDLNVTLDERATIGGGWSNTAQGPYSVVSGGGLNTASGFRASVGGGESNKASGSAATVPGGLRNLAGGGVSFAAGNNARAKHDGSIVIAANDGGTLADSAYTSGAEQMVLRADGHFYLTDANGAASIGAGEFLNTSTGAYLTTGGTWTDASDRNLKENFEEIDGAELLSKILELPITTWNYKAEAEDIRRIGPVAQDFYRIFGFGSDDKSISGRELASISLAAIQELQKKTTEIDELRAELDQMRETVESLRDLIKQ